MKDIEQVREALEGASLDDVAIVLLDQVEALVANDHEYFTDGRGNSLTHTLQMIINTIKG